MAAPLLGEHNEEVLRDLLRISEAEIAALYSENVLVRDRMSDIGEQRSESSSLASEL